MSRDEISALPRRSLRRNFSAALVGNVVFSGAQFGILISLAHMTTAVEVGRYALSLAITSPVFLFAGLKLRQVQVSDATGVNAPGEYFGLRLASSLVAFVGVAVVVLVWRTPADTAWTVLAVALAKVFDGQIDIYYGLMQRYEQMHLIARSQVVRGIAGLVVFVIGLRLSGRVEVAAAGFAGATALQMLANAWRVHRMGVVARPQFPVSTLWRLARLTLPLGISMVLASLIANVPRYVLELRIGTGKLGVFAVLAYLLVASGTIANALVDAASPRLANLYAGRDVNGFRRTLAHLMAIGAILGIGGVVLTSVLGAPILRTLFGAEYAAQNSVLVILAGAATLQFTAVFLGTSVNAMRLFRVQMPINFAAVLAVGIVAWCVVPRLGLAGSAVAVLAGEVVQGICYVFVLRRVLLPRLQAS